MCVHRDAYMDTHVTSEFRYLMKYFESVVLSMISIHPC